jgi:glycine oxidase
MSDILVIGGGVSGLLSARELAMSGATVTLLERQAIGREASWAGGGILSPLYPWRVAEAITALCRWSQAVYPQLADALQATTGIDVEWARSGLLVGDCLDGWQAEAWCQNQAMPYARLTLDEIRQLEPEARLDAEQSIYLPEVAQIRNPRLLTALRADLRKRRVKIRENHEVSDFSVTGSQLESVTTPSGTFSAGQFVIAAGAWSGLLCRRLMPDLEISPVKGQMILFAAKPGLLKHIVLHQGLYLIPRRDGRILVGSTMEYTGFDKGTTQDARDSLEQFALSIVPALKHFAIERHWAGLRPASASGVPFIGRHVSIRNLFFNCGHFRNGFVMAPASARLLADLMLGRAPIVSPRPYGFAALH